MDRIQIVAIVVSLLFLLFIVESIRKERIKEAYSLIWLFMGCVFLFFSVCREALHFCSTLIGVAYPPALLFLVIMFALLLILIQFSVVISKHNEKIKNITQELALLKEDVSTLSKKNN